MSLKLYLSVGIIIGLLGLASFLGFKIYTSKTGYITAFKGYVAEVYYSPDCGCCINYINYLRDNGLELKLISTYNTEGIKNELGIPRSLWSCHTTKIDRYFVEGHVPISVIKRLVEEKPDIDGIALPDMPYGSPGMAGQKTEPFIIYEVSEGQSQIFEKM